MSVSERHGSHRDVLRTFLRVDANLSKIHYELLMCAVPTALAPRPRLALMAGIKLRSGLWKVCCRTLFFLYCFETILECRDVWAEKYRTILNGVRLSRLLILTSKPDERPAMVVLKT